MLNRSSRTILLTFLFLAVFYIYGSSRLPLFSPDEPRYAQVARQMRDSSDYIVPHLGPSVWFEKPVLLYWMMSAAYSILGVNELAARLPSAIAALLTVWLIYRTVREFSNEFQGWLTAMVLGTTAFFSVFSHAASFDMLLTFTVTAALCLFLMFQIRNEPRYLYGFYLFAGLGVLAKGLVVFVLVGLPIAAFLIWTGGWKQIGRLKPWLGIITILVASIWFLPVTVIYGKRFWYEFVYQHHFVRYTSSFYHRAGSPFFYVPVLLLGALPWTITPIFKRPRMDTPEKRMLYRLAVCWLLATLIFFSLSQSKLTGYILPCIPAFAILAGGCLVEFLRNRIPRFRALILLLFLSIPIAGAIIAVEYLPGKRNWNQSKNLSLAVLPELGDDGKLVFFNINDFVPAFYTNARVELTPEGYLYNIENDRQLYRYLQGKGEAFVVVENEDLSWMPTVKFWKVVNIIHGKERSIVHLRRLNKR